jgi:hypothetical protein
MNPYAPPVETPYANHGVGSSVDVARLRAVARSHRLINLAILTNLCMFGLIFVLPGALLKSGVGAALLALVFVGVGVLTLGATAWLAYSLSGVAVAVLCVLLMFVPAISIVTLLILSRIATRRLRAAGCRVGLLGADLATLPR